MHLDNLPLKPGKDLDDKLHARFPLYHGLLPANGSMADGICQAFEEMLAAQGVKATVKAGLTSGLGPKKITAMNFTITSPPVRIGPSSLPAFRPPCRPRPTVLVASQTGNAFDTENTAIGLRARLRRSLPGSGLCGREVEVTRDRSSRSCPIKPSIYLSRSRSRKAESTSSARSTIRPTRWFRALKSTRLWQDTRPVRGRPLDLFLLAVRDAYHARGYLDCSVVSHPSFNEATHIVNYSLEIVPGPALSHGCSSFRWRTGCHGRETHASLEDGAGRGIRRKLRLDFRGARAKAGQSVAKWMQTVITPTT